MIKTNDKQQQGFASNQL